MQVKWISKLRDEEILKTASSVHQDFFKYFGAQNLVLIKTDTEYSIILKFYNDQKIPKSSPKITLDDFQIRIENLWAGYSQFVSQDDKSNIYQNILAQKQEFGFNYQKELTRWKTAVCYHQKQIEEANKKIKELQEKLFDEVESLERLR